MVVARSLQGAGEQAADALNVVVAAALLFEVFVSCVYTLFGSIVEVMIMGLTADESTRTLMVIVVVLAGEPEVPAAPSPALLWQSTLPPDSEPQVKPFVPTALTSVMPVALLLKLLRTWTGELVAGPVPRFAARMVYVTVWPGPTAPGVPVTLWTARSTVGAPTLMVTELVLLAEPVSSVAETVAVFVIWPVAVTGTVALMVITALLPAARLAALLVQVTTLELTTQVKPFVVDGVPATVRPAAERSSVTVASLAVAAAVPMLLTNRV
jgi:hypothetical protein